jgi:hypothetical protein
MKTFDANPGLRTIPPLMLTYYNLAIEAGLSNCAGRAAYLVNRHYNGDLRRLGLTFEEGPTARQLGHRAALAGALHKRWVAQGPGVHPGGVGQHPPGTAGGPEQRGVPVIHGSTDKGETTWCGEKVLDKRPVPPQYLRLLSWTPDHRGVTCDECLHAALDQSCAKCKVRKRVAKEDR